MSAEFGQFKAAKIHRINTWIRPEAKAAIFGIRPDQSLYYTGQQAAVEHLPNQQAARQERVVQGISGLCSMPEQHRPVRILPFDDEFHQELALDPIQEKFRKAVAQC